MLITKYKNVKKMNFLYELFLVSFLYKKTKFYYVSIYITFHILDLSFFIFSFN